ERRLPLLATGEIVEDYSLLYAYWDEAGSRAEEAVLRREDFDELKRLVEAGVTRLDALMEALARRYVERIDIDAAVRAVERVYGVRLEGSEAARRVAAVLAGWLVEAAGTWGMVRYVKSWIRGRREDAD
ncbi:MAG: hypothetical protein ABWW70_04060, partial [Thermoproteota archaeon]